MIVIFVCRHVRCGFYTVFKCIHGTGVLVPVVKNVHDIQPTRIPRNIRSKNTKGIAKTVSPGIYKTVNENLPKLNTE